MTCKSRGKWDWNCGTKKGGGKGIKKKCCREREGLGKALLFAKGEKEYKQLWKNWGENLYGG